MSDPIEQHTVRARLAEALRGLRLDSGRSGEQLAAALGWSQSKVSKIERGRTRPSGRDVDAWAHVCGADAAQRAQLRDLAEAALVEARHWRVAHRGGVAQRQREIGAIEERADRVRSFQPALVPGLLQTAAYAQQVLKIADISGQRDIPAAVAERLRRQEVLYREQTRFDFVLTEAALLWCADGPDLLVPQIDRLLSVGTLKNIGVRVLPTGMPSGQVQSHGFLLYEEGEESRIIVETYTRELILTDPDELAAYSTIHQEFTRRALSTDESRVFLRDLRKRISHRS